MFAYRREAEAPATPPSPVPTAGNGNANAPAITAVTSAQGLAEFRLETAGPWLVEVVHVRAGAERKSNPSGAWEIFEATYSFVVRDAPAGPAATPAGKVPTGGDGK